MPYRPDRTGRKSSASRIPFFLRERYFIYALLASLAGSILNVYRNKQSVDKYLTSITYVAL